MFFEVPSAFRYIKPSFFWAVAMFCSAAFSSHINAVDLFPTGTKESAQYEPQGKLFEDFFNISDHWNFGGPSFSISRLIFSGFLLQVGS